MMTLNNTSIHIMTDSGTFKGFMITRKQSEDNTQYDQWRGLTVELAFMLMCTGFIISKLEQANDYTAR